NPAIRNLEIGNAVINNHFTRWVDRSGLHLYGRTTILGQSDVEFRSVCNDECPKDNDQFSFRIRRHSQKIGYRFLSMIVRRSCGSNADRIRGRSPMQALFIADVLAAATIEKSISHTSAASAVRNLLTLRQVRIGCARQVRFTHYDSGFVHYAYRSSRC
ncbi:hypothetical protein AB4Y38_07820, partial [Paraburkholderia sp. EG285A]|uniref:hypothetical protein n=1 Tax=Paraburkholderia sp. EG285A TaxID=3237009 RepID=UPI0034D1D574